MGTTTETDDPTASLQGRARRLRHQADALTPLLAETYRRRAAELNLQAWLEAVWNPPLDLRAMKASAGLFGQCCEDHGGSPASLTAWALADFGEEADVFQAT